METLPQLEGTGLARVLKEDGFQLCPGRTGHWILIKAPSLIDAYDLAEDSAIADCSAKMRVFIQAPDTEELLEATPQGDIMQAQDQPPILQLGGQPRMTIPLLQVCEEILFAGSDRSLGLVRLRDNHQVGVNGGQKGNFLVGNTIESCTQWRREEYWNLESLELFLRESRQSMEPNSQRWFEFTYTARIRPGAQEWRKLTSRYRLVFDGIEYYHLGENLAMEAITP